MKKASIYLLLFFEIISCNIKRDATQTEAIKNLPSFNIIPLDSSRSYNSILIKEGTPLVFLYFRTDCPHCNNETKELLKNIKSLKNVNFYFLTSDAMSELKEFNNYYHLTNYKNIFLARDDKFSFAKTFRPKYVPFIAIYDKQKKLIAVYQKDVPIKLIQERINGESI
jgi:hypothetical protein